MKSLFDRFRRKPAPAENPPEPAAKPLQISVPLEKPVRAVSAMTAFHKPSWHGSSPSPVAQPRSLQGPQDRKAATEMLTLTLGDFLDRIPPQLLDGEEHDRSMPLPFDLSALSERIGRGSADIPVSEIYRRVPDVFSAKAVIDPAATIRFPWQKVLSLVTQVRDGEPAPGLTTAALDMLSIKLKARKFRRTPKMAPVSRDRAQAKGSRTPKPEAEKPTANAATNFPEPACNPTPALAFTTVAPVLPAAPEPLRIVSAPPADSASESAAALDLARLKADYEQKLAAAAEERDKALAELDPLRKELAAHLEQVAIERREAAGVREKLSLSQKEYCEIVRAGSAAKAERDAAQIRAEEFGNEHDAAVARTGEIAAERDAAISRAAELTAERDAALASAAQLAAERDAALAGTAANPAESEAAVARTKELTAERDTAITRTTELTAERDTAVTRSAELTAERDTAITRATELTAERDAAITRSAELTAERDAAITRSAELTAERDAAITRSAELTAERDTAITHATELTAERDAAVARATTLTADSEAAVALAVELTAERDAALASTAAITAERDASVACAAELLKAQQAAPATASTPDQAAWEARALAGLQADIENYRARIGTLLGERDALRAELDATAPKATPLPPATPARTPTPQPDAYSTLFPKRIELPRAAAALALGLVGIGIAASRIDFGTTQVADAVDFTSPSSLTESASSLPATAEPPAAEEKLRLEIPSTEETMTLLPAEPLLGANVEETGGER